MSCTLLPASGAPSGSSTRTRSWRVVAGEAPASGTALAGEPSARVARSSESSRPTWSRMRATLAAMAQAHGGDHGSSRALGLVEGLFPTSAPEPSTWKPSTTLPRLQGAL
jgi:hypothetical protein